MPGQIIVAKKLAELCKIASHPDRIRIIESLHSERMDVKTLAEVLGMSGSRVSQHLSLLRAHNHVEEEREGRQHFYHLTQPKLAEWIFDGLEFIENRPAAVSDADIAAARRDWTARNNTARRELNEKRIPAPTR